MGCSPWGCEELDTTERLPFHFSFSCIGEGNGNPLQCSCLENPRDGGAWWAAIYGVTQSRTQLKRLSSSSSSRCWHWGAKYMSIRAWGLCLPIGRCQLPLSVLSDFLAIKNITFFYCFSPSPKARTQGYYSPGPHGRMKSASSPLSPQWQSSLSPSGPGLLCVTLQFALCTKAVSGS